jgi:hypothetical protein
MGYQQGPQQPDMPGWVRIIALIGLAFGILLLLGTVVGGMSSETLGMNLAMATGGPLAFGIIATAMSGKGKKGSPAKPLGCGCVAGFCLSLMVFVFFASIWPSL